MRIQASLAPYALLLAVGTLAVAPTALAQGAPRRAGDAKPPQPEVAAEGPAAPCDPEGAFHRSTVGFGLGIGIAYLPEIDGINQRLVAAGLGELPTAAPYLSLALPASLGRLMALAQLRLTSASAEVGGASFDTLHATLSVGYSLTPPETLAIYPFVGLGLGSANLTLGSSKNLVPTFDQAIEQSSGPVELSTLSMLGTAGMGADLLLARVDDHPTRGLFASARVGITASFYHSDWSFGAGQGSLSDGPSPPLGGLFAEVGAGLRF
jgi:hypothetical protein